MTGWRKFRRNVDRGFGPLQALLLAVAMIMSGLTAEHAWLTPLLTHATTGR